MNTYTTSNSTNSDIIQKLESHYKTQIKIIAILLAVISIFILVSLISYTPKDEINTDITLNELFLLLKNDPIVKSKIDTTFNWLGILGAIIANFLINSTFGYSIFLLPILLLFISKDLFFKQKITFKTAKKSIFIAIFWILFSTLMGTFIHLNLFINQKEWAGLIGLYLSNILTNVLPPFPIIFILTLLILSLLIIGFDFKFSNFISIYKFIIKTIKYLNEIYLRTKTKFNKKTNRDLTNNENENEDTELAFILNKTKLETIDENDFEETNFNDFEKSNLQNITKEISQTISPTQSNIDNTLKKQQDKYNENDKSTLQNQKIPIIEKIIVEKNKTETETLDSDNHNEKEDRNQETIANNIQFPNVPKHIENPEKKLNIIFENPILSNDKISNINSEDKATRFKKHTTNNYKFPPLDLLIQDDEEAKINEEELKINGKLLQEKLETFKIYIENLTITPGPVVTLYEFVPAPGIKISKIESFADDMAMALKARGIRIIAPIPGKGTIGIEIPNNKPSLVRFSSVVKSQKFLNSNYRLPLALGKTISGEVFCTDLSKMPHLLMAGATGSGKSVGINTIIASLIFKMHPNDLKFVIIDPKKVELKHYSVLENHFLAISPDLNSSIITEPQEAVVILKALCAEMDKRYSILSSVNQRNIFEYNEKIEQGKFKDDTTYEHRKMPYIVLIIDELADLMLTASKEIEAPIIRLAQLARAVGIHCVVATQRPSVDVITGIIKANFPSRISYLVASKIDSRTILDVSGAEQLIGNGDMLFISGGTPKPIRIQNAFITTEEIEAICEYIVQQPGFDEPYILPSITDKSNTNSEYSKENRDPLFEDAARLVIQTQQASVSLIQRRLKVGFARAGRIMDELEAAGVVGPFDGKTRQVYFESLADLEKIL